MENRDLELERLKARKRRASFTDDLMLHLMAFPGVLTTFLFAYMPLYGLIVAFKTYKAPRGILGSEWCGLENFKFLFSTDVNAHTWWEKVSSFFGFGDYAASYSWIMIRNTIGYNVIFIVINLILAVILALLLNEMHNKIIAKVVQTIYIMPYFLAITTVALLVENFLSSSHGVLTSLFARLGKDVPDFYREEKWWPTFFIIINAWKSVGYSAIVYLASIAGINKEFYEAAMLDGATKWQQARYITIPHLRTMISILLIMSMGSIFNGDIGLFYNVPKIDTYGNILYKVTMVLDSFVYFSVHGVKNAGVMATYGQSVAVGLLQNVVGLIFILLSNKIVNKIEPENALF